jgi:hypothetical protein
MPRWASRLTLEITDVRVERVQDISFGDVEREGVRPADSKSLNHVIAFSELWDETNGAGAWDRNDWVWCLTFRKVAA